MGDKELGAFLRLACEVSLENTDGQVVFYIADLTRVAQVPAGVLIAALVCLLQREYIAPYDSCWYRITAAGMTATVLGD